MSDNINSREDWVKTQNNVKLLISTNKELLHLPGFDKIETKLPLLFSIFASFIPSILTLGVIFLSGIINREATAIEIYTYFLILVVVYTYPSYYFINKKLIPFIDARTEVILDFYAENQNLHILNQRGNRMRIKSLTVNDLKDMRVIDNPDNPMFQPDAGLVIGNEETTQYLVFGYTQAGKDEVRKIYDILNKWSNDLDK